MGSQARAGEQIYWRRITYPGHASIDNLSRYTQGKGGMAPVWTDNTPAVGEEGRSLHTFRSLRIGHKLVHRLPFFDKSQPFTGQFFNPGRIMLNTLHLDAESTIRLFQFLDL